MRSSRRIPFPIGALILALVLLRSIAVSPTVTVAASNANLCGRSAVRLRLKMRSPRLTSGYGTGGCATAILAVTVHGGDARATTRGATLPTIIPTLAVAAQAANAAAAPPGAANANQNTESRTPTAADAWNEAADALAAKILERISSGNALALTVKNISSLGDDDVAQVRRALRAQLRSRKARLTASKQANADVQVTLSENAEGYLWIAEIRDHAQSSAPGDNAANSVVMVSVARPNQDQRHPTVEPLSIRKTRIFQQSEPMLDVALLDNPNVGPASSPAPSGVAARILVLGLASVTLYEQAETPNASGKSARQWQAKQSAPITRLRPWPRDARGRIIVRTESLFDAYLPGVKCGGALEPALTLECHESDDPWPLVGNEKAGSAADSVAGAGPAAFFAADRNFFDGRVRLDDGREVKVPPFLAVVVMPRNAAIHAGLPGLSGRVPPGATGPPGWVLNGLDGRAQLLNSNAQPVANVGGWGSQTVGLETGCGAGWQVLASQARDLNESDALQAYEIVDRKPVPASGPIDFAGPITELWPLANGSEAIAISRNLQTEAYEAFRLSISCGQ